MATSKPSFGSATQITCTVNNISNAAAQQSAVVDMSSDPAWDVLLSGSVITASGSLGTGPLVNVYVYAPANDGTVYTGGASGSDASYTVPTYWQAPKVAVIPINTAATAERFGPIGLAQFFGGVMPKKFGIIVEDKTGLAMGSTGNTFYHEKIQGNIV